MNHASTLMRDMEQSTATLRHNGTNDNVSKSEISAHFLNKAEEEIPMTTINIDCNAGDDQTNTITYSK